MDQCIVKRLYFRDIPARLAALRWAYESSCPAPPLFGLCAVEGHAPNGEFSEMQGFGTAGFRNSGAKNAVFGIVVVRKNGVSE